jgi:hypothetical protein
MKLHSVLALAAAAGLASTASAQFITTSISASISLTWQEDPAFSHNDNGVLEPGEHALILATLSFTANNPFVSFSPSIGVNSSGTVTGLGTAYFDIRSAAGDATGLYNNGATVPVSTSTGPANNTAGTSGYGVRGGWRLGANAANGQPAANGFANIGPGQLPTDPTVANGTNPITNIDRLGWTPNSYSSRTQTFSVSGAAGAGQTALGLYLDLDGGTTGGVAYIPLSEVNFGSINIPIAPAPASLALLGLGGLVAGRRRR